MPDPVLPTYPAPAAPGSVAADASWSGERETEQRRRRRRLLLWGVLVALLVVAQSMLVWLTVDFESNRAQEEVDFAAAGVATAVRQAVARDLQNLQALPLDDPARWQAEARELMRTRRELVRIERRDGQHRVLGEADSPLQPPLFSRLPRKAMDLETELACTASARLTSPSFSRSYFVPLPGGMGMEVIDVCMPTQRAGRIEGFLNATIALHVLLDEMAGAVLLRAHEISFIEGDGTRLARAGVPRGASVFVAERLVDLPGQTLRLRVDSSVGRPQLIPNVAVALVLGLSLALGVVVLLLVRDVRRRSKAEHALAEALAFRKAMEDSLLTGLRARDLHGRVSYVNPAFCEMVGFSAEEIIGRDPPPYWPPDMVPDYQQRQRQRLRPLPSAVRGTDAPLRGDSREGFETTFMRSNGERFSVLIFEAPLVNGQGRQTGWMSAALDVSDQRRMEELARQQQERLQATARLATVGEMASLLSHELNQPLAAISSYAAGSLNLMREGDERGVDEPEVRALLRQATERIAEQAERAGRVIKSVHDFVRRREQAREPVRVELLVDAVLPLVRLQARKSGARIEVDIAPGLPRVVCDRTMVEQVLLNLSRNGIQAMEASTPPAGRELLVRVRSSHARWLVFSVIDRGPGIAPEVAQRLFTPFFTTRAEGMGLGLSLCRTVIEQHGGALDHERLAACSVRPAEPAAPATEFRFTLPAETRSADRAAARDAGVLTDAGKEAPQPAQSGM
jgi:two-component system, LuxR family, sensor histidine kinase DctS